MNSTTAVSTFPARCRFTAKFYSRARKFNLQLGRLAALGAVLSGALLLGGCSGGSSDGGNGALTFRSVGTFNVVPSGGEVAEIVAAAPDGNSLLYTDAETGRVGRLDISNLSNVTQTTFYEADGEPTSVAITRDGAYAIVVVAGANEAVVLSLPSLAEVRSIPLPGQPDSIAIAPDGRTAAIAIENQRDEDLNEGALPQLPTGSLFVLDLNGTPNQWTSRTVALNPPANIRFNTDVEPEFVDINDNNQAVVTLQENNAIAIVDLSSGAAQFFEAGTTTHPADLQDNDAVSFTDTLTNARREPDGVQWTPRGNIVTANEGDYDVDLEEGQFVGGRNFTVFSRNGSVLFDENGQLEVAVNAAGAYDDRRSDAKGTEPENVEITRIDGRNYLFVALERAGSVAVYDFNNELQPRFLQVLSTGAGSRPEGVVAIPSRNLLVTANEGNGTLSFFAP